MISNESTLFSLEYLYSKDLQKWQGFEEVQLDNKDVSG
jgi:hypothetical protein